MARNIRVRAIKRRELDEDKLALAFLLLAKALSESQDDATLAGRPDEEAA